MLFFVKRFWLVALIAAFCLMAVGCAGGDDDDTATAATDDDDGDDDDSPSPSDDDSGDDDSGDDDSGDDDSGDDDFDEAVFWLVDGGAGYSGVDVVSDGGSLHIAAVKGRTLHLFSATEKGPWTEEEIVSGASNPALFQAVDGTRYVAYRDLAMG